MNRRVVINLLIGKGPKATLKKAEIVEAAKMALKRDISKNEYEKVSYLFLKGFLLKLNKVLFCLREKCHEAKERFGEIVGLCLLGGARDFFLILF